MRFDIALMRLLGLVGPFDNHIGFLEARFHIAMAIFGLLVVIGGRLHFRQSFRDDMIVNDRRALGQRLIHIRYMRKNPVLHVNEFQRLAGRRCVNGSDRSHRVAIIKRLLARHAVFQNVEHATVTARVIG